MIVNSPHRREFPAGLFELGQQTLCLQRGLEVRHALTGAVIFRRSLVGDDDDLVTHVVDDQARLR
ncbi:MAG: hypothetical protein J2P57_21930, partial [Acidimicrobiaceae bacterium]|nr:hypothetical protein [Acidimicrobiaceae bacterium]